MRENMHFKRLENISGIWGETNVTHTENKSTGEQRYSVADGINQKVSLFSGISPQKVSEEESPIQPSSKKTPNADKRLPKAAVTKMRPTERHGVLPTALLMCMD
jgi:hypothetical protein